MQKATIKLCCSVSICSNFVNFLLYMFEVAIVISFVTVVLFRLEYFHYLSYFYYSYKKVSNLTFDENIVMFCF